MNDVDFVKCMDLAGQLGLVLGVNPVWKDDYVIYIDGFDDDHTELSLDLDDGRWQITTGDYGVLYLPEKAPWLMAEMSELVKKKESRHGK